MQFGKIRFTSISFSILDALNMQAAALLYTSSAEGQ